MRLAHWGLNSKNFREENYYSNAIRPVSMWRNEWTNIVSLLSLPVSVGEQLDTFIDEAHSLRMENEINNDSFVTGTGLVESGGALIQLMLKRIGCLKQWSCVGIFTTGMVIQISKYSNNWLDFCYNVNLFLNNQNNSNWLL